MVKTVDNPQSILVIGPAWVGDMVMAQALFKALRERHGEVAIDVVAPAWSGPLLARMPEVRETIELPVAHGELGLRTRWRIARSLRQKCYDQAIVLPRSAKAALLPWFAGIPVRTGYRGEHRYAMLNDIRPLDEASVYRTVDRYVGLALPRGEAMLQPQNRSRTEAGNDTDQPSASTDLVPVSRVPNPRLTSTLEQQATAIRALGLDKPRQPAADQPGDRGIRPLARQATDEDNTDKPVLSLCPGAEYGPAKRWPAAYFAALARAYLDKGWRVWLIGSANDQPIAAQITQQAPSVEDLTGQTELAQAIDLLAASRAVVANDSGLMHVAAATGTPLVALYGSSDPQYTPPLSDQARILYRGLSCSPCFERECPLEHLDCLRGITPTEVSDALTGLLGHDADQRKEA